MLAGQPVPLPALFPAHQSPALLDGPGFLSLMAMWGKEEAGRVEESHQSQWVRTQATSRAAVMDDLKSFEVF